MDFTHVFPLVTSVFSSTTMHYAAPSDITVMSTLIWSIPIMKTRSLIQLLYIVMLVISNYIRTLACECLQLTLYNKISKYRKVVYHIPYFTHE